MLSENPMGTHSTHKFLFELKVDSKNVASSQFAATLEFGGKSRSNELSRKVGMELPLFDARIQLVLVYFDYLGPIQILDMFQNCCM